MAEITSLREDFENGADGAVLDTTSTIFTNITGTAPDATFVQNPYAGDLAMRVDITGGLTKTYRVDYTSVASMWVGFALRFDSSPTAIATVFQMYQATTVGFAVRLTTLGELQLRDGLTTRFTSSVLSTNEWYWVSVRFDPGSATGARLKLYDRSATEVYDSGAGAATATTVTGMDNLRVGYLAGAGDASYSIDRLRADTTTEIAAIPAGTTVVNAEVVASPATPDAYTLVTLTTTATGATPPYTYSWSQLSGSAVTLSGTGATRTFIAPALTSQGTLTFQCIVTPTSGTADTVTAEVPIKPHNFWTKHGGVLVPRRVTSKSGGIFVP